MIHTKEEIKIILDTLYKDLESSYNEDDIHIYYKEEIELARGDIEGGKTNVWKVSIEDRLFETVDFLTISDETGEPLYFQTKHRVFEIEKNENDKYQIKADK